MVEEISIMSPELRELRELRPELRIVPNCPELSELSELSDAQRRGATGGQKSSSASRITGRSISAATGRDLLGHGGLFTVASLMKKP